MAFDLSHGNKVRVATTSDSTMSLLRDTIEFGMPESKSDLPLALRDYHQFRNDLNTVDGIIVYKDSDCHTASSPSGCP